MDEVRETATVAGNLGLSASAVDLPHVAAPAPPYRVVLADGCAAYRDGLQLALEAHRSIAVVAEAGDCNAAIRYSLDPQVSVLAIDLDLPSRGGIEVCRTLAARRGRLPVILLSYWDWDGYLAEAYAAGAAGFVLKRSGPDELANAVRASHSHRIFTLAQLQRIHRWESGVAAPLNSLAAREWDVLWEVVAGKSNREIALDLTLSESTVEKYVSTVLRKLNLASRSGLLAYVMRNRLGSPGRKLTFATGRPVVHARTR